MQQQIVDVVIAGLHAAFDSCPAGIVVDRLALDVGHALLLFLGL